PRRASKKNKPAPHKGGTGSRVAAVEAGLLRGRGRGERTSRWRDGVYAGLAIMFFLVDIFAGLIPVLMQVFTLGRGEFAVGFIGSFLGANGLLFLSQFAGLFPGEFAGAHSLRNARVLQMLAAIHAGIQRPMRRDGRARAHFTIMLLAVD